MLWVRLPLRARSTTSWDKICQLLVASLWFPPVSSTNKTDCRHITEILLKVALNTINPIKPNQVEINNMQIYFSTALGDQLVLMIVNMNPWVLIFFCSIIVLTHPPIDSYLCSACTLTLDKIHNTKKKVSIFFNSILV